MLLKCWWIYVNVWVYIGGEIGSIMDRCTPLPTPLLKPTFSDVSKVAKNVYPCENWSQSPKKSWNKTNLKPWKNDTWSGIFSRNCQLTSTHIIIIHKALAAMSQSNTNILPMTYSSLDSSSFPHIAVSVCLLIMPYLQVCYFEIMKI